MLPGAPRRGCADPAWRPPHRGIHQRTPKAEVFWFCFVFLFFLSPPTPDNPHDWNVSPGDVAVRVEPVPEHLQPLFLL